MFPINFAYFPHFITGIVAFLEKKMAMVSSENGKHKSVICCQLLSYYATTISTSPKSMLKKG